MKVYFFVQIHFFPFHEDTNHCESQGFPLGDENLFFIFYNVLKYAKYNGYKCC